MQLFDLAFVPVFEAIFDIKQLCLFHMFCVCVSGLVAWVNVLRYYTGVVSTLLRSSLTF